jgi:hypothetical protein
MSKKPRARPPRIEYPGAYYHVMNRGNRREDIFLTDKDPRLFLDAIENGFSNQLNPFFYKPSVFAVTWQLSFSFKFEYRMEVPVFSLHISRS